MHQKSGSEHIIELHGSLWRLRCPEENTVISDSADQYKSYTCRCGVNLRLDIVWFGDALNKKIVEEACELSS